MLFIDTSWDEIVIVVEEFPNYFEYNDNFTAIKFKKQKDNKFYKDLNNFFNVLLTNLDDDGELTIHHKILEFLKDFIENHLVE